MKESKENVGKCKSNPTSTCVETLSAYKNLSDKSDNHYQLIKDRTVLLYIATLLESNNNHEILTLCLEILDNLTQVERNLQTCLNVFGLFEGLNSLSLSRKNYPENVSIKLNLLLQRFSACATIASRQPKKMQRTYLTFNIYLPGLTKKSKVNYERLLLSTKGIVSFVMDVENKSSMIRTYSKIAIESVMKRIAEETTITPLIIITNKDGNQEYVDASDERVTGSSMDIQKVDETTSVNSALSYVSGKVTQTRNTFNNLIDKWNEHFYW